MWYAQGACTNPIYPLSDPKTAYLVEFTRQLANDKLAPATLVLSFSLGGVSTKATAEIVLEIEAMAGAKPSRTVLVSSTYNAISLDLHAGRYRLLWPELAGYQPACLSENEKTNCELDLVQGARTRVHMDYQPMAKVTLVPVSAAGTPINLLGELEWLRIDAPEPNLAKPNQNAVQDFDVQADELNALDERSGRVIVPGRYQLNWVVKSYAPTNQPYDTCELLRTEKFPLRWRIGAGALANEHDIPVGHSVVLAEFPESSRVNLEFTQAQKNGGEVSVSPRCTIGYEVSKSTARPLKVAAFRGQQYQLEYGCYSCKPRLETSRTLLQADQDLVLEVK